MNERNSLLNKIRSKYILKDILIYAFGNMKSVLKFVAYDKSLFNKLDINIKDYFDYKTKKIVEKRFYELIFYPIFFGNFFFIPLIIYNIRLFKNGKFFFVFWLIKNYQYKLDFIYFIDNYITGIFLVIELIYYLFCIIYYKSMKIILTNKIKFIIKIIHFFIYLAYYVIHCIKYSYTRALIKNLLPNYGNVDLEWFYNFDEIFTYLWPVILLIIFISSLCYFINSYVEDKKSIFLYQINGFDISDFELPTEFDDLNNIGKIQMIFKKENMKRYKCELDDTQKILINKIVQLRRQNNIPEFRKFSYYGKHHLPDYIINQKTELIFYEKKNIYKFYNNFYLIKYPISECQKDINDNNIINIITKNFLDRINIIRKDDYEYISLYNNQFNENENESDNNIRRRNNINDANINLEARINIPSFNISNSEDRLDEHELSLNLSD